jgi:acyl-CoA hydrolase
MAQMTEIVLPEDSNPHGSIFGGRVLALIDKCAAICAIRHARTRVVTAAMDSVVFVNAVRVGHVLLLSGRLNAAFDSSMEVEVEVHAEDPLTGDKKLTTCALVTMVSVDGDGRPRQAPALEPRDDDDRERIRAALERRSKRLAERSR